MTTSLRRVAPFFENRLNEQNIPNLVWLNKDDKIFCVPWRYHKKTKWGDPDAFLLREMAKVVYGYNGPEEPTQENLSRWKSLLRNNFRSLKNHFEPLPSLDVLRGDNPYKVYRLVSNKEKHVTNDKGGIETECREYETPDRQNGQQAATNTGQRFVDKNNVTHLVKSSVCQLNTVSHPIDAGNLSTEQLMNTGPTVDQNEGLFNANAIDDVVFDFASTEPELPSNRFRSRSPITTNGVASSETINSNTGSLFKFPMRNRVNQVADHSTGQWDYMNASDVAHANFVQEVASVLSDINNANNTEASCSAQLQFDSPAYDTNPITVEGASPAVFNNMVQCGFQHRTFLSLTRMLNSRASTSLGVEVNYYNIPSIQPRIILGDFRICHVADSIEKESMASYKDEQQFGPPNLPLLELPPAENCLKLSIAQKKNINTLLHNVDTGIVISIRNGDIYATRYCRAGVIFSQYGRGEWQHLKRLSEIKIFDYDNYKLNNCQSQIPTFQPFVRLSFAVRNGAKSVVTVDIWHMEGLLTTRQAEESESSLEPDLSLSNDFDKILSIKKKLMASDSALQGT